MEVIESDEKHLIRLEELKDIPNPSYYKLSCPEGEGYFVPRTMALLEVGNEINDESRQYRITVDATSFPSSAKIEEVTFDGASYEHKDVNENAPDWVKTAAEGVRAVMDLQRAGSEELVQEYSSIINQASIAIQE